MSDARAFLERAVERHGGRERWLRARIGLTLTSLTGLLPWMKGAGRSFPRFSRVELEPHAGRATFHDYPRSGQTARFAAGRVALGDAPLVEHRQSFGGRARRRRWSPLDAVYFFGYALTHYHALPFTLHEARLEAWHPERRALTVSFPPSVHTHSAAQTFYFDESGLIVRHDYVAEVIGGWARGAHFWRDYVTVEGMAIATHRRVLGRVGRVTVPLVALDARLADPRLL